MDDPFIKEHIEGIVNELVQSPSNADSLKFQ